jgi:cytochrome c-type biogenesis protein CcmH/NrfG
MKHSVIAFVCSAVLAWPLGAAAAGGGGDEPSTLKNQDPEYVAAMDAVAHKDWQLVVDRMGSYVKRKPDDANGWNELGHAYRLTGRIDVALDAYGTALKIDPKHRGVHEYLGEAYLQKGDLQRAEEQLKVLDKLCFFPCEEYRDLKRSIADYKKKVSASSGS